MYKRQRQTQIPLQSYYDRKFANCKRYSLGPEKYPFGGGICRFYLKTENIAAVNKLAWSH